MPTDTSQLQLVAVLLLGVALLTPLARRLGLPPPVVVMLFGAAVGFVPFVPTLRLPPALILPLVLPPLLFTAARRTTSRAFVNDAVPISLLAVGLVFITTFTVAMVAHEVEHEMTWAAAFTLGAIVSPPDPVAATSVAGRLRLPSSLVTILEGEGLFNDGIALVLYRLAVSAVVAGALSAGRATGEFVIVVGAGGAIGVAMGWTARWLLAHIREADAEGALILLVPYASYLVAELAQASGVLAVLTTGLFLSERGIRATTAAGSLAGRGFWTISEFVISNLAFALVGVELASILIGQRPGSGANIAVAVLTAVVVIAVRPLWIAAVFPLIVRSRTAADRPPLHKRSAVLLSWAGMRGVVTVASALALPLATEAGAPFPARPTIVVSALLVVAVTLVIQGLTLPVVVRLLGLRSETDSLDDAGAELRAEIGDAGLAELDRRVTAGEVRPEIAERARDQLVLRRDERGEDEGAEEDERRRAREVGEALLRFQRDRVLSLRRSGTVDPRVADELLTEIARRLDRGR